MLLIIYCLLSGVFTSVMISLNGNLTMGFGQYNSPVVIHIVSILVSLVFCIIKRESIFPKRGSPLWSYSGGILGILNMLFANFSYGKISMTSIVALSLLGQSIFSLLIDFLGLFGMEKRPVSRGNLIGIILSFVGIFVMLDFTFEGAVLAVIFSFAAGIVSVLVRMANSRFAQNTGIYTSTFFSHVLGLVVCIIIALCLPSVSVVPVSSLKPWMYLGGLFGVLSILMFNFTVPKVSAFNLSLLSFVGMVFSGIILDIAFGNSYSPKSFWGGLIISIALIAGMFIDRFAAPKGKTE